MTALLAKALALSFVLPSGVLLRQMSVQRSNQLPDKFDVAGTITLTGDEARRAAVAVGLPPQDPLIVPARFGFTNGKCTLEVTGGSKLVATNTGGQVTFEPTSAAQNAGFAGWLTRLGCLPFLYRGEGVETSSEAMLRKAGGDLESAALTLESGEVSYIVGAGEEGAGKFGLVIQKHGLLPVRAWEVEGTAKVEVLFRDYRAVFRDGGFPALLELRVGGQTVARFNVTP